MRKKLKRSAPRAHVEPIKYNLVKPFEARWPENPKLLPSGAMVILPQCGAPECSGSHSGSIQRVSHSLVMWNALYVCLPCGAFHVGPCSHEGNPREALERALKGPIWPGTLLDPWRRPTGMRFMTDMSKIERCKHLRDVKDCLSCLWARSQAWSNPGMTDHEKEEAIGNIRLVKAYRDAILKKNPDRIQGRVILSRILEKKLDIRQIYFVFRALVLRGAPIGATTDHEIYQGILGKFLPV